MEFESSEFGKLPLSPGLPENFKGPHLNGSKSYHFSAPFGVIVLQEIEHRQFTFHSLFLQFLKRIVLTTFLSSGLQTLLANKGKVRQEINKQPIELKERQYALVQGTEPQWKIKIRNRQMIHLIISNYGLPLDEDLLQGFPYMEDFLKGKQEGIRGPFESNKKLQEEVRQIFLLNTEPKKYPIQFRIRLSEFYFNLLDEASEDTHHNALEESEKKRVIYAADNIILKNILKHYTITELAGDKHVNMSSTRFKRVFKQVFRVGPYRFLLNARLDKIKESLEQGQTVEEAALQGGYTSNSFTGEFKKRFGVLPKELKRKGE